MIRKTLAEAEAYAIAKIRDARRSVELIGNLATGFAVTLAPLIREGVRDPQDKRQFRALFGVTKLQNQLLDSLFVARAIRKERRAWEVRTIPYLDGGEIRLIIDRNVALSSIGGRTFFLNDNAYDLQIFVRDFEQRWSAGTDVYLLYADDLPISGEQDRILIASQEQLDRLLREIRATPEVIYSIASERFEQLVCELLARDGLEVQLTPASKDGGKDILAWLDTPVGRHLYYVECKRYAPENPVGVRLVRQLYGLVEAESATAGMLVTTSRFTRGAIQFKEQVKNRLDLRGYDDLIQWISKNERRRTL